MVATSFGQTFVRVSGPVDAPPFVLLPGAGATSYIMTPNIAEFSENFRTYAFDHIYDYGRSVYSQPIKKPDDYVTWLDELFTALGLGNNINLRGGSMGGWQAALYALRHQNRLNKLVLLAPGATVMPYHRILIVRLLLAAFLPFRILSENTFYWLMSDSVSKDKYSRTWVDEFIDEFMLSKRSFKLFRIPLPTVFSDEELQSIKIPTLVIYGENEKMYSAHEALERLQRIAPKIKAEIIPNAGHDVSIVQAEIFNEYVVSFLKGGVIRVQWDREMRWDWLVKA